MTPEQKKLTLRVNKHLLSMLIKLRIYQRGELELELSEFVNSCLRKILEKIILKILTIKR